MSAPETPPGEPTGAEDCGVALHRVPDEEAATAATALKALGHPARVRIVAAVRAAKAGEVCVCDLQPVVDLAQPTVSHHLKVLVDAGLLTRERRGSWSWYALDDDAWRRIGAFFA